MANRSATFEGYITPLQFGLLTVAVAALGFSGCGGPYRGGSLRDRFTIAFMVEAEFPAQARPQPDTALDAPSIGMKMMLVGTQSNDYAANGCEASINKRSRGSS